MTSPQCQHGTLGIVHAQEVFAEERLCGQIPSQQAREGALTQAGVERGAIGMWVKPVCSFREGAKGNQSLKPGSLEIKGQLERFKSVRAE